MARRPSEDEARARFLDHLQLGAARAPGEAGSGPLLDVHRYRGEWIGRLWLDGERYGEAPRPLADRWLRLDGDVVVEEPADDQARHAARRSRERQQRAAPVGRPRKHPVGAVRPHRPRITFTPYDNDRPRIERLMERWQLSEAETITRLVNDYLDRLDDEDARRR